MRARIAWAVPGVLLGCFGMFRLVTEVPPGQLLALAGWLAGAVVVHDAVLAPLVVGVGWLLATRMPPRSRRHVQGALIAGSLVTVVAAPMILRMGHEPPSKALLQQPVAANLAILLGLLATTSAVLYAVRVLRDREHPDAEPPT
jgi:hypothetical protein